MTHWDPARGVHLLMPCDAATGDEGAGQLRTVSLAAEWGSSAGPGSNGHAGGAPVVRVAWLGRGAGSAAAAAAAAAVALAAVAAADVAEAEAAEAAPLPPLRGARAAGAAAPAEVPVVCGGAQGDFVTATGLVRLPVSCGRACAKRGVLACEVHGRGGAASGGLAKGFASSRTALWNARTAWQCVRSGSCGLAAQTGEAVSPGEFAASAGGGGEAWRVSGLMGVDTKCRLRHGWWVL